jgi:uncharacterized protein YkwD
LRGYQAVVWRNPSFFAFWCVGLLTVVVALLALPQVAQARETYVAYATRILESPPDGAGVSADIEAMVLRATNAYRAEKGLPALKPASGVLKQAARAHAMDLLLQGGMGHTASTGHDFGSRIRAFHEGQMFLAPMAENAARLRKSKLSGAAQAQALVKQWIGSSGHRRNMTNRTYVTMAVGVALRGEDVYAVQIFSGPTVKTNLIGN